MVWRVIPMKYRLPVCILLVCCLTGAAARQQTGVEGYVRDSEGAAIAGARILVHWDPAGSEVGLKDNVGIKLDLAVTTDSTGKYTAIVPPGFYDVFVSSMAFTPVAAKVRVKSGWLSSYNAILRPDPLVSKELAD